MSWLFKQLTVKDLIGALLALSTLWYTTRMGQQSVDAQQDRDIALIQQQIHFLEPLLKQNSDDIKQVHAQLEEARLKLERKADRN